jgi:hypothetical protein
MNIYSDFTIPVFGRHVTILRNYTFQAVIWEKTHWKSEKMHQCSLEDGNGSESPKFHADDNGETDMQYFNEP